MKNIYLFSEADSVIKESIGKKACEMIEAVPGVLGFVLTQEACVEFLKTGVIEKNLHSLITETLDSLCLAAGVKFGESAIVSVTGSTLVSMPGIIEKIDGIGLNETVLNRMETDEMVQKGYVLYLELIKTFSVEVFDISSSRFLELENKMKEKYDVDKIADLRLDALRELCIAFKNLYVQKNMCDFPSDPYEQLFWTLKGAFRSWDNPRANVYRRMHGISEKGLSIAVQLVDIKTGRPITGAEYTGNTVKSSVSAGSKAEHKRVEYDGGDVYDGEILNGKRHGYGTYIWADGDTYEGEWKEGKRCGHGKMIQYGKSPDGETYMKYSYDGEWIDSKEHGHGICVEGDFGMYKNDKVYEGEWVNGKRQGRFVWYLTNSNGGRYINFYENGKMIESCIPYDESIKTVEDARHTKILSGEQTMSISAVAKENVASTSEEWRRMDMSEILGWNSVKSGEYKKKQEKEAAVRNRNIKMVIHKLRNPDEFASWNERNIESACMLLEPFVTEAENLFLNGNEIHALQIIEEILGINIEPEDDWYYNSNTKYFSQFLSGAFHSLAVQIDFETPDHDRFIIPAVNIACYIWKKYGDYSLFYAVAFLWTETGKGCYANYLWVTRMKDNGDYTVPSHNEIDEYYFGHDLDVYTMGSDCELF